MKRNQSVKPLSAEQLTAARVASALVHLAEYSASGGHAYNMIAARAILQSPDVIEHLDSLRILGLLPVRRDGRKPWEV